MPTPNFTLSPARGFKLTKGQAFLKRDNTPTLYAVVTAYQPLWGFGSFKSSSGYKNLQYNDDWPLVYNTLTETWTDDGGTQTNTTTFSQYIDIYQTASSTGFAWAGAGGIGVTVTSTTVTANMVSINYLLPPPPGPPLNPTPGTYTAVLSGTLLNPSAPGPFDPGDANYGWQALTNLANALLPHAAIPPFDPPGGQGPWDAGNVLTVKSIYPISTSPGYTIDGNGISFAASMNGFPVCSNANNGGYGVGAMLTGLGMNPSIIEYLSPYANWVGSKVPNQGGCVCSKANWQLGGQAPVGSGVPYPTDHTHIYLQQVIAASMSLTIGPPSLAANYANPLATPVTISFSPADVTAHPHTAFGILGFRPTAT